MTHESPQDDAPETQSETTEPGVALLADPLQAPVDLSGSVEAALLSVDRPLSHARLAVALGLIDSEDPEGEDEALLMPLAESAAGEIAPSLAKKPRGRSASAIKAHREALNKATAIINTTVASLNEAYERSGRSFRVEQVAGGFRVMTLPAHARVAACNIRHTTWMPAGGLG